METVTTRRRRSAAEVRRLLLESAEQCFAETGYSGTSTREIARRAGVSETLVYRHFGSKADLFGTAVTVPFREFLDDFVTETERLTPGDTPAQEIVGGYIARLYDFLHRRRDTVMALISAHSYEDELGGGIAAMFAEPFARLEALTLAEHTARGFKPDVMVITRAVISMVMGLSVMDEWMFPPGRRRPGRDRIVREVTDLVVNGLAVTQRDAPATAM